MQDQKYLEMVRFIMSYSKVGCGGWGGEHLFMFKSDQVTLTYILTSDLLYVYIKNLWPVDMAEI